MTKDTPTITDFVNEICNGPLCPCDTIFADNIAADMYVLLQSYGISCIRRFRGFSVHNKKSKRGQKNRSFNGRISVYWVAGDELDVIELLHTRMKYTNIQWKELVLPILGSELTREIKNLYEQRKRKINIKNPLDYGLKWFLEQTIEHHIIIHRLKRQKKSSANNLRRNKRLKNIKNLKNI